MKKSLWSLSIIAVAIVLCGISPCGATSTYTDFRSYYDPAPAMNISEITFTFNAGVDFSVISGPQNWKYTGAIGDPSESGSSFIMFSSLSEAYNFKGKSHISGITISFDKPIDQIGLTVEFTSANAVPIPSAMWLLAAGIGGLWEIRRRNPPPA